MAEKHYENPFRPMSFKVGGIIFAIVCTLFFGWYALENFAGFKLTDLRHPNRERVRNAEGTLLESEKPIGLLVPVTGCSTILLAMGAWMFVSRRMAKHGQMTSATVLEAKTLKQHRVVTLGYTLDGQERMKKVDLPYDWAQHLSIRERVDIMVLEGFLGGLHVLGRTRIHAVINGGSPVSFVPRQTEEPVAA